MVMRISHGASIITWKKCKVSSFTVLLQKVFIHNRVILLKYRESLAMSFIMDFFACGNAVDT